VERRASPTGRPGLFDQERQNAAFTRERPTLQDLVVDLLAESLVIDRVAIPVLIFCNILLLDNTSLSRRDTVS
jgi:hypothetical protein